MTSISLAMIVKNEEKNIGPCLWSVADLVDEIVIVDTGSTDDTLEAIEGFERGMDDAFHEELSVSPFRTTIEVHKIQWSDDFSMARNHALKQCTGEWIIQVDADELLDPSAIPIIKQAINDPDMVFLPLSLRYPDSDKLLCVPRLFRNIPGKIYYEYPYHEQVSKSVKRYIEANPGKKQRWLKKAVILHKAREAHRDKTAMALRIMGKHLQVMPQDSTDGFIARHFVGILLGQIAHVKNAEWLRYNCESVAYWLGKLGFKRHALRYYAMAHNHDVVLHGVPDDSDLKAFFEPTAHISE